MFWGITLESGKKYTQVLQKSFSVTMAALGFENPSNDRLFVMAEVNKTKHVLCSLQSGKLPQQPLNLNFTEGEEVSFYIEGEGTVHLTGYLTLEDNDSDLSDSSCDEGDKGEAKGDARLQSKLVNGTASNYHDHVTNNEKVSEVSWQGILSGSQESTIISDDEGDVVQSNGRGEYSNKDENKKSDAEISSNEALADEKKLGTRYSETNGGTPTNSNSVTFDNIFDNHRKEYTDDVYGNGYDVELFTNENENENKNENSSPENDSDDDETDISSDESDTRYVLVDENSKKRKVLPTNKSPSKVKKLPPPKTSKQPTKTSKSPTKTNKSPTKTKKPPPEKKKPPSETKKTSSETKKTSSETKKTSAGTKKTNSETKKPPAGTKKTSSETKKPPAETKKTSSETKKTSAETKKTSAETKKTSAETKKTSSETKKPPAETKKTSSETKKTSSETKKTSAETKKTSAETKKTSSDTEKAAAKTKTENSKAKNQSAGKTKKDNENNTQKENTKSKQTTSDKIAKEEKPKTSRKSSGDEKPLVGRSLRKRKSSEG